MSSDNYIPLLIISNKIPPGVSSFYSANNILSVWRNGMVNLNWFKLQIRLLLFK